MPGTPPSTRPLSPHLTIYRPQITTVLSILHRVTGVGLVLMALLLVWWFLAAATSDAYFLMVNGILTSWFGKVVLTVSLWAFWYHFANGIRHLAWDAGHGFALPTVTRSGIAAGAASVILTAITLAVAWSA